MDIEQKTFPNFTFFFFLVTGWSVKGERWGRGPSKPSSPPPAVIPSALLQRTDTGDWSGLWSLNRWDKGLKTWVQMTAQLMDPTVTVWLGDGSNAGQISQHQSCSCFVHGPYYMRAQKLSHGVLNNKWTLLKFSKFEPLDYIIQLMQY